MIEDNEHYARNLLGWRAIKGELKLQAFDRLVMDDITEDVRLRNVFAGLGCESLNEFLVSVANQSPRNYGRKSEYYLAECLNRVIVQQGLVSGLSEGLSEVGRGIELQVIYGELDAVTMMRHVKPALWSEWRDRCLKSPFDDRKLSLYLTDVLMVPPTRVPDVTLSDAIDRWRTLDSLLCEDNATLLSVVRAAAWCANKDKLSDIDVYLSANPGLLFRAQALLDSAVKVQEQLDLHYWNVLWGIVKLRGLLNCGMGEVVPKANANWPSNRLADPVSSYYEISPQLLLKRDRMGKIKTSAVQRCVTFLAIHGHRSTDATIAPWEIIKLLKLKKSYLDVLNIRYAGDRVCTLDSCGKQLGVTRERVRQIEVKCAQLSVLMHRSDSALAWLKVNIDDIWRQLSSDGGVTVDSKDESELALEKKLGNEYRLGLLLANIGVIQLLNFTANRTESGWSSRVKGESDIVIRLSGKVKVVNI